MHQRTVVRAIVTQADRTLVLKRANGRPSILKEFEIPGGKIGAGEQPEDAVKRIVTSEAGVEILNASLLDVLTYQDPDFNEVQYVFIVFRVEISKGTMPRISENYDDYALETLEEIQHLTLTSSSKLLLSLGLNNESVPHTVADDTPMKEIILYTDGGSRGNPGPSSAGYVIKDMNGNTLDSGGKFIGVTTNSMAEYQAALLGLERAKLLNVSKVNFRLDSQMVVNQMNGLFKIRNRELWPVHEKIKALEKEFRKVMYVHVPREQNTLADAQVNAILDEHETR